MKKGLEEMAKKNFKDNPALQFISTAGEEEEEEEETKETPQPEALKAPTGVKPPAGYKFNSLYVETKSKRVQLVLQPSLFERVKKGADKSGLSVNEFIHRILDSATKEEEQK